MRTITWEQKQESRSVAKVNPTQAQTFLGAMDHPAGKDKIVKCAEQNDADENALDVLHRIPDRQRGGSNVVSHEINGDE